MNSFVTGLTDEEGTQAVDFAQRAGQLAQQLGLSLSKNQAYPGDYGYGLDPDTDFSNQTAFSPTISSLSESDFDPDDPLQFQTGGPVQYFQDGGQSRIGAFGGVGGEFGGLGFDAGVGTGDTSGAAGGTAEGIDPVTAFLTESRNLIPSSIPGVPDSVASALSQFLGQKSIADAAKAIAPTLATSLVPQARLGLAALNTVNTLRNVDEGKENAFTTAFRNATGLDLAGMAKGRIGMESQENPAEQDSVYSPTFGLQEQGGG